MKPKRSAMTSKKIMIVNDHPISGRPVLATSPEEVLTNREFEIFELIGEGKTTAQIAKDLRLSPKTVGAHYDNIRRKLKLARWKEGHYELKSNSHYPEHPMTFLPVLAETMTRDISRADVEEWASTRTREV